MKNIIKLSACGVLFLYLGVLAAGCSYHTYYDGEEAPPGEYELKDSKPIAKEKVVERHYVVE